MRAFVAAELRARTRMIAGLAGGAFTYLLIVGLSYHSLGVEAFGTAFHGEAPRTFTALSGSHGGDVLSPHGWMGLGFNHPMFLITSLTVAIAVGAGAVAGEVDSGRAELLFTTPHDRRNFLSASIGVWAIAEAIVVAAALAGALLGAVVSDDLRRAGIAELLWAPVQYAPLTLFVAAIAFASSARSATRSRAVGIAIGAVVFAYLVSVVSGMIPSLDWLRWCSPFGYYDPGSAIAHGPRPWPIVVLLAASAILFAVARAGVARRDLA